MRRKTGNLLTTSTMPRTPRGVGMNKSKKKKQVPIEPLQNPQTQCPRAIRECSRSVQSKSGLAALPASVLPEKTEVCRLYFYLTLPNRWCAQMRRTERRGYRLAKAVELLVKVRRRTKNLVPAASPREACPMESG